MALRVFARVAQLRVPLGNGAETVGSALLIGPRLLLTAAHVLEGEGAAPAPVARVLFPERAVEGVGRPCWSGRAEGGLDAALVELADPPLPGRLDTRWGRLTGQRPGVPAFALGFPRALREDDGQRVPDQPAGTVNPGVGFGARYDLNVAPPYPLAGASDPSPWSGLSGGPLLCGDLVVGVVVLDVLAYQPGRLTAVPASRLLDSPGFRQVLARHQLSDGWESVELAPLFERRRVRLDSPASLLRADAGVVRFRGRDDILTELRDWADDEEEPLAVALVTGPGGQGKTRLANELVGQLRGGGWVAAPVKPTARGDQLAYLPDTRQPTLLVIDYAETRSAQVQELVAAAADPVAPVRLLLLARGAGEWWHDLRASLRYQVRTRLEIALPALENRLDERHQAYADALIDLAEALPRLPGRGGVDWPALAAALPLPNLRGRAFGSPLTLHLQALTDLLTAGQARPHSVDPEDLEDVLLEHEELYWRDTAARAGLTPPDYQPVTLRRTVAVATVCGAADEPTATTTVACIPDLPLNAGSRLGVARWLAELYPSGDDTYWGSLQPDRLGEHLLGRVTRDRPDLLPLVLAAADTTQQVTALTVLARAALHQPHLPGLLDDLLRTVPTLPPLAVQTALQAPDPVPLLHALRTAAATSTNPTQLAALANALPDRSLLLAETSLAIAEHTAALFRKLSLANPHEHLPGLADSLTNLSNRLAGVGRRAEALPPIEEAVTIRRGLAEQAPDAYLPHLAGALTTLSRRLAGVGRRAEALPPAEEAVTIRRGLAEQAPGAHLPRLAGALITLSTRLAELGRPAEALPPSEEAVAIYRGLAGQAPRAHLPNLALSLTTLSTRLAEVARPGEALPPIEEAVAIRRRLAQQAPDAYLPDLAGSLITLSTRLAAVVRPGEALPPIEEAVAIRRRLVEQAPGAYLPHLAGALTTLSRRLAAVGRPAEALPPIEEAVAIRRRLVEQAPGAYLPDLAGSLTTLSNRLAAVGRLAEALPLIEKAVTTYLGLAEQTPSAFAEQLQWALRIQVSLKGLEQDAQS